MSTIAIGAGAAVVLVGGGVAAYYALRTSGTTKYRGVPVRWFQDRSNAMWVAQASVRTPLGIVVPIRGEGPTKDQAIQQCERGIDLAAGGITPGVAAGRALAVRGLHARVLPFGV